MYGNGGLELLIIDEGHYLWPVNITEKPKRIEFIRALYDEKRETIGIAEFTTPQGLISMNLSLERCERWAPGQWEGRLVRFRSDDATTEADLARVARWHAPEADEATIKQLVIYAQASPGLLGSMIGVLKLARFNARDAGHKLGLQDVRDAIIEATSSPKLVKAMKEKGLVS